MAVKPIVFAAVVALLLANRAAAQSVALEAAQTGGLSSTGNAAAATQARLFGDAALGVTFNLEGAWAVRSGDDTDAFGAAYPYDGRVQVIEAYGERMFRPAGALLSVRGGRFRTPFGIYSASDHAYSGFLRAPLIRYGDYFALSNNYLENGISVAAGVPRLYVETTIGMPGDVGEAVRPRGADTIVRAQASYRSLIVGASYIDTKPYQSPQFAHGRATFGGLDARWMRNGIEIRGEWIGGRPFDGTRTTGGYVDVLVHRPGRLSWVTAVARAERLGYVAVPPFDLYAHRYTAGARLRLLDRLSAQMGVVRQSGLAQQDHSAVDLALTYVVRLESRRPR
jgi:hypothetical protein